MVNSHSSYSTYKLEIREMIFIAQSRVWVDLQSIIISEVEGSRRKETKTQFFKNWNSSAFIDLKDITD